MDDNERRKRILHQYDQITCALETGNFDQLVFHLVCLNSLFNDLFADDIGKGKRLATDKEIYDFSVTDAIDTIRSIGNLTKVNAQRIWQHYCFFTEILQIALQISIENEQNDDIAFLTILSTNLKVYAATIIDNAPSKRHPFDDEDVDTYASQFNPFVSFISHLIYQPKLSSTVETIEKHIPQTLQKTVLQQLSVLLTREWDSLIDYHASIAVKKRRLSIPLPANYREYVKRRLGEQATAEYYDSLDETHKSEVNAAYVVMKTDLLMNQNDDSPSSRKAAEEVLTELQQSCRSHMPPEPTFKLTTLFSPRTPEPSTDHCSQLLYQRSGPNL